MIAMTAHTAEGTSCLVIVLLHEDVVNMTMLGSLTFLDKEALTRQLDGTHLDNIIIATAPNETKAADRLAELFPQMPTPTIPAEGQVARWVKPDAQPAQTGEHDDRQPA